MAADMFLMLKDIDGESVDAKHGDEIEVLSWNWGATQSGSMHDGTGGGSGKVNMQDITLQKSPDKSTPKLIAAICKGTHIPEAKLTVRKAGGDEAVEYLVIEMKEVLISSYQTGGSGGDSVVETLGLNFADVGVKYTPQKEDGTADSEIEIGYNIRTAEAR